MTLKNEHDADARLAFEPPVRRFSYATEQRLRFIEVLAANYGSIDRSPLMDFFGISGAQATRDFQLYAQANPGALMYNKSLRVWMRATPFSRIYA